MEMHLLAKSLLYRNVCYLEYVTTLASPRLGNAGIDRQIEKEEEEEEKRRVREKKMQKIEREDKRRTGARMSIQQAPATLNSTGPELAGWVLLSNRVYT